MKFYLAHAVTHDGEHEYGELFTLMAANEHEAAAAAKRSLLDIYADPDEDAFDEEDQLDLFDRIVVFDEVREISCGAYLVLREYL
jgi:hypothetical protein